MSPLELKQQCEAAGREYRQARAIYNRIKADMTGITAAEYVAAKTRTATLQRAYDAARAAFLASVRT